MSSPTLEGLPVEVLTLIIEHALTWLPNIRLVSKTLCAAALNVFAEEYMQLLVCYVLDPTRLERTKNITSNPTLAAKVKRLVLTTDCFELLPSPTPTFAYLPEFSLAPEEQLAVTEDYSTALREFCGLYRAEQADLHHLDKPDLSTLPAILRNLAGCCYSLCLDLQYLVHEDVVVYHHTAHEILETIRRTGCQLHDLRLADVNPNPPLNDPLNDELNLRPFNDRTISSRYEGAWANPVLRGLRRFQIRTGFDMAGTDPQGLLRVVQNAAYLEGLELCNETVGAFLGDITARRFFSRVLVVNGFRTLRELRLYFLRLNDYGGLRTALAGCHDTLKELEMMCVCIRSNGHDVLTWLDILETIRRLPIVHMLAICDLMVAKGKMAETIVTMRAEGEVEGEVPRGDSDAEAQDEEDVEIPRRLAICAEGQETIRSRLGDAISCGIELAEGPYKNLEHLGPD